MSFAAIALTWQVALNLSLLPITSQSEIPSGVDGRAIATADMVAAILSYSHWEREPQTIRLCVTGTSPQSSWIASRPLRDGRAMVVTRAAPTAASASACNAVYIGQMAAPDRARLINRLGNDVLTITDVDPGCEYGAAICLRTTAQGMIFDLNLDSVARSRVRIDPRVLGLGRRGGDAR
ncbi:MAG: YfiR family protein [Sphingopyxis sp.]